MHRIEIEVPSNTIQGCAIKATIESPGVHGGLREYGTQH